ncbi:MAG TPA: VOC family protein, partial [Chloroflexia bacterium]|nr:VOC family protein [Chloroflexia bacterium]
MLRGLTTVRYHTPDLEAAKGWYTELLGIEPYFNRPEYVEFRIGDYQHELGLLSSKHIEELGGSGSAT